MFGSKCDTASETHTPLHNTMAQRGQGELFLNVTGPAQGVRTGMGYFQALQLLTSNQIYTPFSEIMQPLIAQHQLIVTVLFKRHSRME